MSQTTASTRRLPILPWLTGYQLPWLGKDVPAGLIVAAVVLPQAMAYATLAGLPLEYGLYCALVPMALYAVFGSSRPLSVSTTSTISLLTATAIAGAPEGADPVTVATTLAFLAGIALLIARPLRLGFIEDFISRPILAGFKVGMGATIAVSQVGKLLGYDVSGDAFVDKAASAVDGIAQTHGPTLVLSIVAIVALVVVRRIDRRIPGPLIVLLGGMLLIAVSSIEAGGVATVPPVPGGLPILTLPDLSLVVNLFPAALAIALMSFIESMAASRAFRGDADPRIVAEQELSALGAANVGGSLFGAYGAGGGLSQTAVNDDAGAKTQLSGLVVVGATVLVLVFLTEVLRLIPEAVLGAVVLIAAVGLMDIRDLRLIGRISAPDLAFGIVTLVAVLIAGVVAGLLTGVVVSILTILWMTNHAPIWVLGRKPGTDTYRALERHPGDETIPGLVIVRPEAMLYFGNAHRFADRIAHIGAGDEPPEVLILDMSVVSDIDTTAIAILGERQAQAEQRGVEVWYAALTESALDVARRVPGWREDEPTHAFATVALAVEAFLGRSRST
jgi:SulP family sulfate permease